MLTRVLVTRRGVTPIRVRESRKSRQAMDVKNSVSMNSGQTTMSNGHMTSTLVHPTNSGRQLRRAQCCSECRQCTWTERQNWAHIFHINKFELSPPTAGSSVGVAKVLQSWVQCANGVSLTEGKSWFVAQLDKHEKKTLAMGATHHGQQQQHNKALAVTRQRAQQVMEQLHPSTKSLVPQIIPALQ